MYVSSLKCPQNDFCVGIHRQWVTMGCCKILSCILSKIPSLTLYKK